MQRKKCSLVIGIGMVLIMAVCALFTTGNQAVNNDAGMEMCGIDYSWEAIES